MLEGMTGEEYKGIFKENGLARSPTVRILEQQIAILNKHADEAVARGDLKAADELHRLAEETKWHAIDLAEAEKAQGYPFITD